MLVKNQTIPATEPRSRAIQQHLFSLLQTGDSIRKITQIHAQTIVGFTQKNYIIVHGYGWSKMPQKSIELYNRMVMENAEPDGFTYSFVLSACVRSGLLKEGKQIHGRVLVNGYYSDVFVMTNLVNSYGPGDENGGFLENARKLFDEASERNIATWNSLLSAYVRHGNLDGARRVFGEFQEKNVLSWTTMLSRYAQNGECQLALLLFHEMRRARVELDQVARVAALSACSELGDLKLGTWIHCYVEKTWRSKNQPIFVSLSNALIHMYASCGLIEEGYKVFKEMLVRTTISWISIITGFAKQGRAQEALDVFQSMLCSELNEARSDEIMFLGALSACSHASLVNEGRQILKCMNEVSGVSPKIEHYGCMVDLLNRSNEGH